MKRGFSIVELLTVMIIVLIIAAITFPIFLSAREKAKQTACLSNLHQVYLGIQMYEQDYDAMPFMSSGHPAWYKYSGGSRLKCYNVTQTEYPRDYEIYAGPDPSIPPDSPLSKKWAVCREKRGMDFPFAVDANHNRTIDGYQGNGRRFLIVRASGSVQSVPARLGFGGWMPCDAELPLAIHH